MVGSLYHDSGFEDRWEAVETFWAVRYIPYRW